MKQQIVTTGIVLARTDYGEADRIITVLTPDQGKLRLMARGVRKSKSKLAGGIELFSTSSITFIEGKGDIGTLISSRLVKHYEQIVSDIERVQAGYRLIKQLNKCTEDSPGPEYYDLLEQSYAALNESSVSLELIEAWFQAQLLKFAGHSPNLNTDSAGEKLSTEQEYNFNPDDMVFTANQKGRYDSGNIKVLRLLFSGHSPNDLSKVNGLDKLLSNLAPLIKTMYNQHLHG